MNYTQAARTEIDIEETVGVVTGASKVMSIPKFKRTKKKFTFSEALSACLEYYHGDLLPASVVVKKYLLRDKEGNFLEATPYNMHMRLTKEFVRIEKTMNPLLDEDIYFRRVIGLLENFNRIVPQGSPMAAVGNHQQVQSMSNCFVVSQPEDSIEGIFKTGLEIAHVQKRRGGAGVDISSLRPRGAAVNNAAGKSSGVSSFSDFYSHITRMIGQNGRQGALMISIDITHPDAESFIQMKNDLTKVTGANVSVKITDAFMRAVEEDEEFTQRWPCDSPPSKAKFVQKIRARDLWDKIVQSAWKNAEPGLLMWDNITSTLPAHNYPGFETVSTNPCGEIPLSPYDSCRLISMNLTGYVKQAHTKDAYFDYDDYHEDVKVGQRMSDGLVELELEAVSRILAVSDTSEETALWHKIYKAGSDGRRTGLGTHGLADCLLQLGFRYDGKDGIAETDKIFECHKLASYEASIDMAEERGAFPIWDWDIDNKSKFIQGLPEDMKERIKKHGRRNIANLTNAPTGSVSIASFGVSSGIECNFRWVYDRRVKITHMDIPMEVDFVDDLGDKWTNFRVVAPEARRWLKDNDIECPIKHARDFSMSAEEANRMIAKLLPKHFVTSDQVDYMKGIELQATIQKHIDHSISRTINLPKGTKPETVSEVYINAWKQGLKGVTVYVDGSRDGVLIADSSQLDKEKESVENPLRPTTLVESHAPKRPKSLPADIHHVKVKGVDWGVVVGLFDGRPYEVFAGRGLNLPLAKDIEGAHVLRAAQKKYKLKYFVKGNGEREIGDLTEIYDTSEERVITRSVCRELRHGIPVEFIVRDLQDHKGSITDYSSALSRVLKKYVQRASLLAKICPACGGTDFVMQEGCAACKNCGHSKCG